MPNANTNKRDGLAKEVRDIITNYFDLDENGNPTIPTKDDLGQVDEDEYAEAAIGKIWKLVK